MGLSSWTSIIIVKEKDRREPDRRLILEELAKNHAATFTGNTLRLDPDTVACRLVPGTRLFANNEHLLKLQRPGLHPSREKPYRRWTRRFNHQPLPKHLNPSYSLLHPSPFTGILSSGPAMGEKKSSHWRTIL